LAWVDMQQTPALPRVRCAGARTLYRLVTCSARHQGIALNAQEPHSDYLSGGFTVHAR
jgi:hypothetical protein